MQVGVSSTIRDLTARIGGSGKEKDQGQQQGRQPENQAHLCKTFLESFGVHFSLLFLGPRYFGELSDSDGFARVRSDDHKLCQYNTFRNAKIEPEWVLPS